VKSPVFRFACRTLLHKWYVFRFGLKTGAPIWRLLIHDWTKFTSAEIFAYAERFCGANASQMAFALAWNHHHKANPHHWEYWIPVTSHRLSPIAAGDPLPMPEWAVREMVADWLGADLAYGGKPPVSLAEWDWYNRERPHIRLHPDSELILRRVLDDFFAGRRRARVASAD
jgi:hypothetical protein